jgi:hypothetical protein
MLDFNLAWSAILSLIISLLGLLGYMMNEKFRELARVTILLEQNP